MYTDIRQLGQKRIFRGEQAVAGVIEALLLVALLSIIISTIQLEYIPQIMEQREAEHMDEVANQFSHLKSLIDVQSLTGSMEIDVPLAYVPMTSQITLGSRELPYFITARAFGEITIDDSETFVLKIFPPISSELFYPLTSIVYKAYNSYFVDQEYVLEGGGIIINQSNGEAVMRVNPAIRIQNFSNRIDMKFYFPHFISIPGKNSTYGHGRCFIRTNYSNHEIDSGMINPNGSIIIHSNYLNAWNESLNRLMGEEIKNGYVDISIIRHEGIDVVKLSVINKPIDLELIVVDIYVQIGPGWWI